MDYKFYINSNIGYQYSPESFLPQGFFSSDDVSKTDLRHRVFGGLGFGYFFTQKFIADRYNSFKSCKEK